MKKKKVNYTVQVTSGKMELKQLIKLLILKKNLNILKVTLLQWEFIFLKKTNYLNI